MFFSWIAISKIEPDAYKCICANDYVRVVQNPGFLKPIGFTNPRSYRPWIIHPRIDVWQEVERRIRREINGSARGRSSVLHIVEPGESLELTYSFTVRFYRPNIVAIEIILKTEVDISLEDAFKFRQLDNHPCVYSVVDSLIGMIRSGSSTGYQRGNSFFSRPAMLLPIQQNADEFQIWKNLNANIIANLLINNKNYKYASSDLSKSIFKRNENVDIKFSGAAISLISKQGIFTAYSSNIIEISNQIPKEHKNALDILNTLLFYLNLLRISYLLDRTMKMTRISCYFLQLLL